MLFSWIATSTSLTNYKAPLQLHLNKPTLGCWLLVQLMVHPLLSLPAAALEQVLEFIDWNNSCTLLLPKQSSTVSTHARSWFIEQRPSIFLSSAEQRQHFYIQMLFPCRNWCAQLCVLLGEWAFLDVWRVMFSSWEVWELRLSWTRTVPAASANKLVPRCANILCQ